MCLVLDDLYSHVNLTKWISFSKSKRVVNNSKIIACLDDIAIPEVKE